MLNCLNGAKEVVKRDGRMRYNEGLHLTPRFARRR
jgi:hypothetical protein